METVPAKQLLIPLKPDREAFFYDSYNMNLYRGCNHGCIYCDSRSLCYQLKDFDTVRVKENALEMLRQELAAKRKRGVVSIGATSDPYNAFEGEMKITQGALSLLRQYGFGVGLSTKSDLVARDGPLLADIQKKAPVRVGFSITTASDSLCEKIEPYAALSSKRFQALESLAGHGVYTGVWLNPVLPFLTDSKENIVEIIRRTRDAGGKYVLCFFGMTLREGNREYFYRALDQDFPGMKKRYAEAFGLSYECPSPNAQSLYETLVEECEAWGLHYNFAQINDGMMAASAPEARQLSLFDM